MQDNVLSVNNNGTITIRVGNLSLIFKQNEDYVFENDKIVIKHAAVLQIADSVGITVTDPEVVSSCGMKHYVLKRTAKMPATVPGKEPKTVTEYGESMPDNLDTKIAKMYPFITANTRAYDRAVLQLIGLSGKVYSDAEIKATSNQQNGGTGNAPAKPAEKVSPPAAQTPTSQAPAQTSAPISPAPQQPAPYQSVQTNAGRQPNAAPPKQNAGAYGQAAPVSLNTDAFEESDAGVAPVHQPTNQPYQANYRQSGTAQNSGTVYAPAPTSAPAPAARTAPATASVQRTAAAPPAPAANPASGLPWWWNEPDTFGPEVNPDVFVIKKGRHAFEGLTASQILAVDRDGVTFFADKPFSKANQDYNMIIESCRRALRREVTA